MKSLQITSSKIVVSKNPHSPKGYFVFHKVKGILPGCRKVTDISITPMAGKIWARSLWSYNGNADIDPKQWAELVKNSPVVVDILDSFKVELTPEVIANAYQDALSVTDCPAVTEPIKYSIPFNSMVVVNGK